MKTVFIDAQDRVMHVRDGETSKARGLFCPFGQSHSRNCNTQCALFDITTEKYGKSFCPEGVAVCGLSRIPIGRLTTKDKEG